MSLERVFAGIAAFLAAAGAVIAVLAWPTLGPVVLLPLAPLAGVVVVCVVFAVQTHRERSR